jgi:type IV pilus assembly protein PilV
MKTRLLSRSRQKGFSLIEVLVSVVIMSVGILGIAGLQVLSLQQNRNSLLRAEALQLGNDILDRMRANADQDYAGLDFTDAPPTATDCVANNCSTAQMKDYDIALWRCSINNLDVALDPYPACVALGITGTLPGGQGALVDNSDDTLCAVEAGETCAIVRWIDDPSGANFTTVALRTRTD